MRNPANWQVYAQGSQPAMSYGGRGYTGHEQLNGFGIINMNARLYDPLLARFLAPDPFVGSGMTNDFNRYVYCRNNPLMFTDPSGESWKSFWSDFGNAFKRDFKKTFLSGDGIEVGWNSQGGFFVNKTRGGQPFGPSLGYNNHQITGGTIKNGFHQMSPITFSDKLVQTVLKAEQTAKETYSQYSSMASDYLSQIRSVGRFFSDGVWTVGITGTASGSIIGASAETGLTLDFRSGFKTGLYFTSEHAVGGDLSGGLILNYHKPLLSSSSFGISDLNGWGETWNAGIWILDGTYGGNSKYTGLDLNKYDDSHSIYNTYGFGISVGTPIGFTRNKGYTWTTPTIGW